jgi:hypothetical protein
LDLTLRSTKAKSDGSFSANRANPDMRVSTRGITTFGRSPENTAKNRVEKGQSCAREDEYAKSAVKIRGEEMLKGSDSRR